MLRCALTAALLLAALPAFAQAPRTFPASALRGEIVVRLPPEIELNGQPARLAPGARIVDERNLLQLSGALVGKRLVVHYTRDNMGQPHQVWILTPAERARQPWPVTEQEQRSWFFDPAGQRWIKP
jgi:hypothetical protein